MSSNDTILTMENITKTFGPVKALTDVNLSVDRGEIHAICGENGAGKSTLMNVLSGVYPYGSYSGKITFDGKECKYHTINDSEADGIVIIHQELALSPFLSIAENIFIGNEQAKGGVIDWDKTRAEAKKLLDRVGLPEDPDTKVMDIGVGKQQLVEIAKALSKDVKLLILDEPTATLNDEDSAHLLDLVRQLRDEQGVTSIIITHKLNEVAAIADNVTIIRDGSTVGVMYVTPETPLDQEELIRKMVGRPLHNLYPNHPSIPGRGIPACRGLDRASSARRGARDRRPCEHQRACRRDRRSGGSDGCGSYRNGHVHLRPLLRFQHLRQGVRQGQGSQDAQRAVRD